MRLSPLFGAVLVAVAAAVAFEACGSGGLAPSPLSGSAGPASDVATSPESAGPSAWAAPVASVGPTPGAPSAPSASGACSLTPGTAPTALDPGLLALLPSSVGDAPVTQEPDSFRQAVEDTCFVTSIDRAAFFMAVTGGDLASGVVAHVRPGVYSEQMFADWRSSYDRGACAQSGSAVAHAEQDVAARKTYVTTCGGGLRVYHTRVAGDDVLVSLLSVGPAGLGLQLIAAVRG